ncbi:MAG TPA: RsmE family RNA methyltransferase [Coriobacteriia bacterium]|nr:RsmE family RNA methyltransferase [Coriobacteriia bacterium]
MSAHRFFLVDALAETTEPVLLPLSPADLHHARSVLRVRVGEELEVAGPEGAPALVRVLTVTAAGIEAEFVRSLCASDSPRLTLVQGLAKGEKMDSIVRQAVEVGAAEIVPVMTQRTIVRLDESKRAGKGDRLRRIAKAAAEQSHRDIVPPVHDPLPFEDVLPMLAGYSAILVLWEEARGIGVAEAVAAAGLDSLHRVALVVGPEGGLSSEEVELLAQIGAVSVTLGQTILRAETAALVALSLTIHALGGLGAGRPS